MQRVLRLIPVLLLSSLIACHTKPITISRTSQAFPQNTGETKTQQLLSNRLEGHFEGIKLDFHQDYGSSNPVSIDVEPTGACLYSDPIGTKRPCHWERSNDRITVRVTEGETLPFQQADDKLTYLKRDGIGGGVCIQLAKNGTASDTRTGLCQGAMMGLPQPAR